MIAAKDVARILGGRQVLGKEVRNLRELEFAVSEGLPVGVLERTTRYVTDSEAEAHRLRDRLIPPASRKRRRKTLKPAESERVERLARLIAHAEAVWEDAAEARAFLLNPHPLLEDRRPVDLATSGVGARRVEDLLYKLEYSLPV